MRLSVVFAFILGGLLVVSTANASWFHSAVGGNFTEAQKAQIKQVIHQYLIKHPEVLVDASNALRAKQEKIAEQKGIDATRQNAQAVLQDPNSPVVGNKNGEVTLVEFFDYQCVHCRDMAPIVDKLIKANPNLRVVFKEFPIFGVNSQLAAKAALAANAQGKYWAFHQALFNSQEPIDKNFLLNLAKKLKLNMKKFNADLNNKTLATELKNNYKLANKLGLMGTPAFIVAKTNTTQTSPIKFSPGAMSQKDLQKMIDKVK